MAKKKAAKKKASKKKATKKKATKKKGATSRAASSKPLTKTQVFGAIAEANDLTRKQVAGVFDSLAELIQKNISRRGPGVFTIPGLLKIKSESKPAQKSRLVRNPATGEMVMSKPKPARRVVKVRALKSLKDMA